MSWMLLVWIVGQTSPPLEVAIYPTEDRCTDAQSEFIAGRPSDRFAVCVPVPRKKASDATS